MILNVVKVFFPAALSFFVGILITPILTHYFYKYRLWKKSSRSTQNVDEMSPEFKKIHNEKAELGTPRVGGMVIWLSVFLTVFLIFLISRLIPTPLTNKLEFVSRNQTLIPLLALLAASLLGLFEDFIQIGGRGIFAKDNHIFRFIKIGAISLIGLLCGLWFYTKLGMTGIHVPFDGTLYLGVFFIPFFIMIILAVFSGSVIDGIDGLAGGVLGAMFLAYTGIAFGHNQIDLAAFCAVISGAILAFLWFNIPPARFYLGETGMLGLTVTLALVAFLTDSVLMLPIIAFPFVATTLSVIIQLVSKKLRNGKRVFRLAPLHHHFESIGWSREKITMRYWILSVVFALLGMILTLIS